VGAGRMTKVLVVWIVGTETIGHVFPDSPNIVHYLKGRVPYEQQIKKSAYEVIEEVTIIPEEET
jgi:hypothetical protein